jgi:hypothetical protein
MTCSSCCFFSTISRNTRAKGFSGSKPAAMGVSPAAPMRAEGPAGPASPDGPDAADFVAEDDDDDVPEDAAADEEEEDVADERVA